MKTIADVAKAANVSTATVSRVLHDSSKVLPETKEKVMAVIKSMDYHPNSLARQFRTQKTGSIVVIVPEFSNTFYHEILAGVESVAEQNGYFVSVAEIHNNSKFENHYFEVLAQKQTDGIITCSAKLSADRLQEFAEKIPFVVACRYYVGVDIPNVTIHNENASRDMTRYLLNLGHRKICCLAGSTDIPLYQDRLNGFLAAMRERGAAVDKSCICFCSPGIQGGYDAVVRLLSDGVKFTAIVASGDTMAVGAIRSLKDNGFRVPEDVAVTGFDDIELASIFTPALSTVRQPMRQIGVRSMRKLLDLMKGKPLLNRQEVLSYELVIRESTGNFIVPQGTAD